MTIPDVDGRDNVMPEDKWAFDADVAEVFDDMLSRSIPQYEVMRHAVLDMVQLAPDTSTRIRIMDLGSSNGITTEMLLDEYRSQVEVFGYEVSVPMVNHARNRLAGHRHEKLAHFQRWDLRTGIPALDDPDVVLSILTLQFIPIEYRERIVHEVFEALPKGGVFIVVEKVLGRGAVLDDVMVKTYLESKRRNGYTDEQIDRKRESLEGVLVPITAAWNEQLLIEAGFRFVDCFWRWMNFAGWVAVK